MKNPSKLMVVFALVFLTTSVAMAQRSLKDDENNKKAEVAKLVNGGRYTFQATHVLLPKGASDTLHNGYVLDISKDTLIAHLPHLTEQGIYITGADTLKNQYTFTHYSYRLATSPKGGWQVTIIPKQVEVTALGLIRQIKMDINPLGYTTVILTSSKHSPVSYYGYIKPHMAEFPPANANH